MQQPPLCSLQLILIAKSCLQVRVHLCNCYYHLFPLWLKLEMHEILLTSLTFDWSRSCSSWLVTLFGSKPVVAQVKEINWICIVCYFTVWVFICFWRSLSLGEEKCLNPFFFKTHCCCCWEARDWMFMITRSRIWTCACGEWKQKYLGGFYHIMFCFNHVGF